MPLTASSSGGFLGNVRELIGDAADAIQGISGDIKQIRESV